MRVVCVAGARPNFVKLAPLRFALDEAGDDVVLVHTGQHYDPTLDASVRADLEVPVADVHLGVGSGPHHQVVASVLTGVARVLADVRPDAVVVVGDVDSTLGAALAASTGGVPVAHLEAGLRSRDWTMPEERNRVVADRVSSWLLAPDPVAVANLAAEGRPDAAVHLVGNVMIDSLRRHEAAARARDVPARLGLAAGRYAVATLHRPANVDDPAVLARLLGALGEVGARVPVVLPLHPRTAPSLAAAGGPPPGVQVVEALGYLDFLGLQADAALVLTDSGGVQEETSALGVPCLTLRPGTERPVTVTHGTNRVVGTEPAAVVTAAFAVLDGERPAPGHPIGGDERWGDGHAARRAVAALHRPPVAP